VLGLRLINGVQVDLYQGDVKSFSCDILLVASKTTASTLEDLNSSILDLDRAVFMTELQSMGTQLFAGEVVTTQSGRLPAESVWHVIEPAEITKESVQKFYTKCLDAYSKTNVRHIVLPVIGAEGDAGLVSTTVMPVIAKFVETLEQKKLLRITFVLDSLENYNIFQTSLFTTFKED